MHIFNLMFPATLGSFGCGTALAWTAPALPHIQSDECLPDDCDISDVTPEQGSWIGAMMPLGAIFAGPITGETFELGISWRGLALFGTVFLFHKILIILAILLVQLYVLQCRV